MRRERKSLRNGVHHANAVVWGPVYRTHLLHERVRGRAARKLRALVSLRAPNLRARALDRVRREAQDARLVQRVHDAVESPRAHERLDLVEGDVRIGRHRRERRALARSVRRARALDGEGERDAARGSARGDGERAPRGRGGGRGEERGGGHDVRRDDADGRRSKAKARSKKCGARSRSRSFAREKTPTIARGASSVRSTRRARARPPVARANARGSTARGEAAAELDRARRRRRSRGGSPRAASRGREAKKRSSSSRRVVASTVMPTNPFARTAPLSSPTVASGGAARSPF
eukprot:16991-Pelagococcus_subviridis.AAC.1